MRDAKRALEESPAHRPRLKGATSTCSLFTVRYSLLYSPLPRERRIFSDAKIIPKSREKRLRGSAFFLVKNAQRKETFPTKPPLLRRFLSPTPKIMDDKYFFFYEQAVKARNFHYDNFSKWQTFFYVAIGAVLVAYCTVTSGGGCCGCANSGDACKKQLLEILLSALGYMFSLIWLCSSRGYTYWWNAYMEKLKKTEKIVAKHFEATDITAYTGLEFPSPEDCYWNPFIGGNFSTSRLANALAFVSAWAWGILLSYTIVIRCIDTVDPLGLAWWWWVLICFVFPALTFLFMRLLGIPFSSYIKDQILEESKTQKNKIKNEK